MSSKRQQIVDALKTLFEGIVQGETVTVLGAQHTYSFTPAKVDVWRETPFGESELPAISIHDRVGARDPFGVRDRTEHTLAIEIDIIEDGSTAIDDVRAMLVDVEQAIGSDETLGVSDVYETFVKSSEPFKVVEGKVIASGTLEIDVKYRTARWSS